MQANTFISIELTILAVFVLLYGILLVAAPRVLVNIMRGINRVLGVADVTILANRWIWGTLFLVAGVYIFYVVYTYDLPSIFAFP